MKYLLLIFICFSLVAVKCTKSRSGPQDIPRSFFFLIKKNNVRLEDNTLNNTKMYYLKDGAKMYVSDFTRAINGGELNAYDLGIQTSFRIEDISANENIKNFYLEYPNSDVDTLFIDYKRLSEKEAFNHPCYCYTPLEQVKYNGITVLPDSNIKQQTVYRFDKQ